MNKNLNLALILKSCPKGTKLYSLIHGDVEFYEIEESSLCPIILKWGYVLVSYSTTGKYIPGCRGECVLFPSKENRDWSNFKLKTPKFDPKTLQPFDKVLVYDIYDICEGWACAFFSHIRESEYPYSTSSGSFKVCIPYNDDTKQLLGTKEEAPEYYRYWED